MDIIDEYGIIQRCERDADGIHFSVVVEDTDTTHWYRYVRFGEDRRHRAGGPAFVEAAREQARQAAYARRPHEDVE